MLAVEDVKILNIKTISVLVLFSSWITAPNSPTLSRIREIRKRGTFSVSSTLQQNTKRVKKKINTSDVRNWLHKLESEFADSYLMNIDATLTYNRRYYRSSENEINVPFPCLSGL